MIPLWKNLNETMIQGFSISQTRGVIHKTHFILLKFKGNLQTVQLQGLTPNLKFCFLINGHLKQHFQSDDEGSFEYEFHP
jgi:hypothetical protein